ncbi:GNAT family N-acetyltransferase [Thalassomonas actiniarum]|uniref:GNAT family N-acetyltransferase n=1 Tax=Thalassomonas actiniarum TaxID=485447 RepID=A0AAF0C2J2_9GAMM|nr:GNAT family N-acetyltransferase [Thalassomonas actiniarum]WDD98572.1 GNAT family N-acetyltransferase [Thalassomonas actiniarum]
MIKQINPSIRFSNQQEEMQLDVIHSYLKCSYWAKGIPKDLVQKSIDNSMCFAAFDGLRQIAFARVITDKASFAYLADVFVLEPYRGGGISKQLMSEILKEPELQGLRRFMLCTNDAHGLYRQFGFSVASSPQNLMAIHQPDIYTEISA